MKFSAFFLLLLPSMSIAAPSRIAPPVERVDRATSYFLRPAVGEVATAEVGDSLYQEGIKTVSKTYFATLKAGVESQMDNGYVLSVRAGDSGQMMMRSDTHTPLLCFMTKKPGA